MIIYVASERPAKIKAVEAALSAIGQINSAFEGARVAGCDVSGATPRMPMNELAIMDAARRRCEVLLERFGREVQVGSQTIDRGPWTVDRGPETDRGPRTLDRGRDSAADKIFVLGLEGGIDPVPIHGMATAYFLKSWACVSDGSSWTLGGGGAVPLPDEVANRVQAGEELGDVIDELAGEEIRGTRGAWGILTCDLIARPDGFRVAVINAFAPFFNRELYRG